MNVPHTIPAILTNRVAETPDAPAVRRKRAGHWEGFTWDELHDRVVALAAWLVRRGVDKGDRVAINLKKISRASKSSSVKRAKFWPGSIKNPKRCNRLRVVRTLVQQTPARSSPSRIRRLSVSKIASRS